MSDGGGIAARRGFRFEDWFVLEQLADVLHAELTAIDFERRIGDGFEARLHRANGSTTLVQCKYRTDDNWTILRLEQEGVLASLLASTTSGEEFWFVSNRPGPLQQLAATARRADSFESWRGEIAGSGLTTTLDLLSARLDVDPFETFDLLRLTRANAIDLDRSERLAHARLDPLVRVEHRLAVCNALVVAFSDEVNGLLGKSFDARDIDALLRATVSPDWRSGSAADARSQLDVTTASFLNDTRPAEMTPRTETRQLLSALEESGLVALRAPGGYGKSAVLAEALDVLLAEGWSLGALDARHLPTAGIAGLRDYQTELGFADGIVEALLLQAKPLLVVDQLDSIAPALTGNHQQWSAARRLIDRALQLGVKVLVAARPVGDVATLLERSMGDDDTAVEIRLEEMSKEQMTQLLGSLPALPAGIPRIPIFGELWRRIASGPRPDSPDPANATDLLEMYRRNVAETSSVDLLEMATIEDGIATNLLTTSSQFCPAARLRGHEAAVERLIDAGYLSRHSASIAFAHECLADHAWASGFDAAGLDVESLLAIDRIAIARRIRDLLQYLANGGEGRHADLTASLRQLTRDSVRPAFLAAATYWIASCDRTASEAVLPIIRDELAQESQWRRDLAYKVLRDNCRLFDGAFDQGLLHALAVGGNDQQATLAWIASNACSAHSERIEHVAIEIAGTESPQAPEDAPFWQNLAVAHPTPLLISTWCRWFESSDKPDSLLVDQHSFARLSERAPQAGVGLMAAWLRRHRALALEQGVDGPFSFLYDWRPGSALGVPDPRRLAELDPGGYVGGLAAPILDACRDLPGGPGGELFTQMFGLHRRLVDSGSIGNAFVSGLAAALSNAAPAAAAFFIEHQHERDDFSIGLCARALMAIGDEGVAIGWLQTLAADEVPLTGWSHRAIAAVLATIEDAHGGLPATIEDLLSTWSTVRRFLGASGEVIRFDDDPVIRSGPIESRFGDEAVASWSDTEWLRIVSEFAEETEDESSTDGLRGGVMQLANQLREQATKDPSRFLALLSQLPLSTPEDLLTSILEGCARATSVPECDLIAVEVACRARFSGREWEPKFIKLVYSVMASEATAEGRAILDRYLERPPPATERNIALGRDDWIAGDLLWGERADTTALAAIAPWVAEHLDEVSVFVDGGSDAIERRDETKAVATVEGLRWVLPRDASLSDPIVLQLLEAFPDLAQSLAIQHYEHEAWRRGWASLPTYWEAQASAGSGSSRAGYRVVANRFRTHNLPQPEEVSMLPTASRVGVAKAATELCEIESRRHWVVPILLALLADPDEAVRAEARRWEWHTQPRTESDVLARRPIPPALRPLIPPTVLTAEGLLEAEHLLVSLAEGTAADATSACELALQLLPRALDRTDLAHGQDIGRLLEVGVAASEALLHDGVSPAPALDLIDRLVTEQPMVLAPTLANHN